MHITQSTAIVVVLAIVLVMGTLASQRDRMGVPFRQRPAAIVLAVLLLLIGAMCVYLATRHDIAQ